MDLLRAVAPTWPTDVAAALITRTINDVVRVVGVCSTSLEMHSILSISEIFVMSKWASNQTHLISSPSNNHSKPVMSKWASNQTHLISSHPLQTIILNPT